MSAIAIVGLILSGLRLVAWVLDRRKERRR
jgi:hypothetical protein